jgi:hypothetical protein
MRVAPLPLYDSEDDEGGERDSYVRPKAQVVSASDGSEACSSSSIICTIPIGLGLGALLGYGFYSALNYIKPGGYGQMGMLIAALFSFAVLALCVPRCVRKS